MPRPALAAQASRFVSRTVRGSNLSRTSFLLAPSASRVLCIQLASPRRSFSACPTLGQGIMPHTDSPAKGASKTTPTYAVVDFSESKYHEIADQYLDGVLTTFEQLQDTREDLDIEFSAGVMTITATSIGTYVINKQPPNKQIWLSSPISGPKRYDWCLIGEGQSEKEDTGSGGWIYARDGSSLNELILEELGVDLSVPITD